MKTQKKKKKKKLRVGRLFLLLIILVVISFLCVNFVNIRINSITVYGNEFLTDDDVISAANLSDYPSFFSSFIYNIKKDLEKNPYIKEAKVKKGFLTIKIKIEENKILYLDSNTNEIVTYDSKFKDDKLIYAPILVNEVPKEKIKSFKKAMNNIDKNILSQMSEIKYDPNDIDSDRYFVYMNDGNGVYLTVNKFKKINNYSSILENIGKQNGILYLDYGDYFKAY